MKALTLRDIPPDIAREIERGARKSGTSLNKAVLELLRRAVGRGPEKTGVVTHDFDRFAGLWSKKDAKLFDRSLAEQRRLDPRDWE